MNIPNLITTLRFPILVVIVLMLYYGGPLIQLLAAPAIVALILMDSLDGIMARRLNQSTLVGSALDIAADRTVEIAFWVVYAHLGLIPVGVPLAFIIRGSLTDSIRNVALQHGRSAHSMMRTPWGHWLVASPAMRGSYAVVKATAFTSLAILLGLQGSRSFLLPVAYWTSQITTWLSLIMCILRGLPVLMEAPKLFAANGLVKAPNAEKQE